MIPGVPGARPSQPWRDRSYPSDWSQVQQAINRAALAGQSAQRIAAMALRHLQLMIGCQSAEVLLLDREQQACVPLTITANNGQVARVEGGTPFPTSQVEAALQAGELVVSGDVPAPTQSSPDSAEEGHQQPEIGSILLAPLLDQDELIGVLRLASPAGDAFSDEHQAVANCTALSLALAIQHSRLLRARENDADQIQGAKQLESDLNEIIARLGTGDDPDEIIRLLSSSLERLNIHSMAAVVDGQHSDRFRLYYSSLNSEILQGLEEKFGLSMDEFRLPRRGVLKHSEPHFIPDAVGEARVLLSSLPDDTVLGLLSLVDIVPATRAVMLPLIGKAGFLGHLIMWSESLQETHLAICEALANQIVAAVRNANLLRDERQARERAETLRQVAWILNSSLDLEQVLDLMLEQLERIVAFDSAAVMLIDEDRVNMVAQRGGDPQNESEFPLPIEALPGVSAVVAYGRPIIIPDTAEDPDWVRMPNDEHIRSWLGIPLMAHEQVIGVLNLNHQERNFYALLDAEWALAFANQAAVAIENARLFRQIQNQAEQLENEVKLRTRDLSVLYDITAISSEYLDLELALEQILKRTLKALPWDAGAIYAVDQDQADLRLAATSGDDLREWLRTEGDENLRFLLQGLLAEEDIAIWSTKVEERMAIGPFSRLVGVPLQAHGRTLGAIVLLVDDSQESAEEDVDLLANVADHVGVAIENARLREQSEALAVLQERERLARELHDSVTQQLYSLALFARAAQDRLVMAKHEQAQGYLLEIASSVHQALKEMRLLLYELRSATFLQDGLVAALHRRVDAVEGRAGVTAHIAVGDFQRLPPPIEVGLFRIAQEALNNALKHAAATAVEVSLSCRDRVVTFEVVDDGRGFEVDAARQGGGMGLTIMAERTAKLKGHYTVESAIGRGTTVRVTIPLPVGEEETDEA